MCGGFKAIPSKVSSGHNGNCLWGPVSNTFSKIHPCASWQGRMIWLEQQVKLLRCGATWSWGLFYRYLPSTDILQQVFQFCQATARNLGNSQSGMINYDWKRCTFPEFIIWQTPLAFFQSWGNASGVKGLYKSQCPKDRWLALQSCHVIALIISLNSWKKSSMILSWPFGELIYALQGFKSQCSTYRHCLQLSFRPRRARIRQSNFPECRKGLSGW